LPSAKHYDCVHAKSPREAAVQIPTSLPPATVRPPVEAPPASGYTVPAAHVTQLLRLVERWHVPPAEMLSGLRLSEADLNDPAGRLPLATYGALLERARAATGEPGLGFYLGLEKRITMYGYVGFAAISAGSLKEALELLSRFTPTLTTSLSLRLVVEGPAASLIVEEQANLGLARDVALISLFVGMLQIGVALTGREMGESYVELAIAEPAYFARFKHLMPPTRFDAEVSRIVFDSADLDLPLVHANETALRLARDKCERDLVALQAGLVERVRRAVSTPDTFRSMDQAARTLAMSPRTLRRRLAEHGVTFSNLLEHERFDKATLYLRSGLSLDDIAERLGFSTTSTFVRSFRRWTGTTPGAYRRHATRGHSSAPSAVPGRLAVGSR
jgi:AraC-like DNA-binding protein